MQTATRRLPKYKIGYLGPAGLPGGLRDHFKNLGRLLGQVADCGAAVSFFAPHPPGQSPGEYLYFVDLEGGIWQEAVKEALNRARLLSRDLRLLGSYPVFRR